MYFHVGFDVELEMIEQVVLAEKIQASSAVGVVLMLGWLLWLWFDVKLSFETNFLFEINRHMKEACQVIELPLHVCVENRAITFPATPKSITFATQTMRDFDGFLDLRGGVGVDVEVGRGGRALGEAWVDE